MANDVNIALLGNETMVNTAAKYIAMVFAMDKSERKYIDPKTRQSQNINEEFVKKIDALSGIRSPKDFRTAYAQAHRYRMGTPESNITDVKQLAAVLLQEQNTFRDVIQAYVTREILPRNVDNISTAYSPDNDKLVKTLMEGGEMLGLPPGERYCKACANLAINAAAVFRQKAEGEMGVYNLSECSSSGCSGCSGS
jgi:predicted Ser/Thr protein kinase